MKKSTITLILGAILLTIVAMFAFSFKASANPSYFTPPVSTGTATTSFAFIPTPGTATSTLTYDSYYVNTLGNYTKTDSAALAIQFQASSSAGFLAWQYEYSQDGSDWYGDSLYYSTTTLGNAVRNAAPFSSSIWQFAPTTVGSSQALSLNKIVMVPTPTRYVRVKFYAPIGSAAVSVWASFIPVKERS